MKNHLLPGFQRCKQVKIPPWAHAIRIVCNGIDGYAPLMPEILAVPEFIAQHRHLQTRSGGGEWDVLFYAASNNAEPREIHPYANNYRRLRSTPHVKVKLLGCFDYMRWCFLDFVLTPN